MTQQPTPLSPGLQALITLRQNANPITQGIGGPMPTIAGAEIAKARAAMQPQMQQMQQGIAGALPQGMQNAAQQARNAAGPLAQNAKDAEVQQMAEQMAPKVAQLMQQQQQPQQMARGGVAGLPANNMRGFKEGGIIGFAKGGSDDVPNPDKDDKPMFAENNFGGASPTIYYLPGPSEERDRLNRLPIDALQKFARLLGKGYDKFVEGTTLDPAVSKTTTPTPEDKYTTADYDKSDAKFNRPMGAGLGGFNATPTPTPTADTGIASPKAAPTKAAPTKAAPATTAAAPASGDYIDRLLQVANTPAAISPAEAKLMHEMEESNRLRKAQPPVHQTALTALQQATQEREALHQKINADSKSNSLAALLGGLSTSVRGQGGRAAQGFEQSENARQAAYTDRKLLDAKEESAIRDAQNAQAAGNQDLYVAALEKLATVRNEKEKTRVQGVGHALQAGATMQSGAAHNATQIQVANIQAAVQREHNNLLKAQMGTKEQMVAAQVEKLLESDNRLKELAKQTILDPKLIPQYEALKNELTDAMYKRVAPDLHRKMVESGALATSKAQATPTPYAPKDAKLLSDYGLKG